MAKVTLTRPRGWGALLLTLALALPASGQTVVPSYTLDDCIHLGLDKQPALAAARASLSAAQTGQGALDRLLLARLVARDLSIRKQQAALGVQIAEQGLAQAEWETRYAVTRNYFSVIYARQQEALAADVIRKLSEARNQADKLSKIGDLNIKVNKYDVQNIGLAHDLMVVQSKDATAGKFKAMAALREAIGLRYDEEFEVAETTLPAKVLGLDKKELVALGLAQRGELAQAQNAREVTHLEICAQSKTWFSPQVKTFAAASDIHAKPIPQGRANGEYVPGAIGLEMPVFLIGKRHDRMDRARDLNARAHAVVDKTENLVALDVEAMYFKWSEGLEKIQALEKTMPEAESIFSTVKKRFEGGNATGEEYLRAQTLQDRVQAQLNEAIYEHALGLAGLERATAGGYRLRP